MTDWANRELIESVRLQLQQLTQFLNSFDSSTRAHLAKVDYRLDIVERKLEQLEEASKAARRPKDNEDVVISKQGSLE